MHTSQTNRKVITLLVIFQAVYFRNLVFVSIDGFSFNTGFRET